MQINARVVIPAMTFYRVPLAVPYWSDATYRRILRSIGSGAVVDGPDLRELRSQVIETLGVREAVLGSSGSLALELALRSCGVGRGDEVVIPTFCCSAVVSPVLAVGATPVLADVGEELDLTVETVGAVLTRKSKAVIVPHLFGNPADIAAIIALVRDKNIRVIDDAAQALGATLLGRPVGSFGDAGILSFGSGKVCFGLGGGAAISRRENFLLDDSVLAWAWPSTQTELRRLVSTLFLRRWRRWTSPLRKTLSRRPAQASETPLGAYRQETMANLNAAVACSLMETLGDNIAARRARVRAYHELLEGVAGLQLMPHRIGSACLTQVIRFLPRLKGRDLASDAIAALERNGYELQGSYVPIHLLSHFGMCVWDNLPHADRIWADLVELPCEPEVSLDHVEQIAGIVKAIVPS
jgi:dTDP-4-amino-4,6-dideoxygalactose transaminase